MLAGNPIRYEELFADEAAGDVKVAALLDAALAVISAYGFRKTSMDDVARRAGVSRVTLYRRFSDKDSLVHAVILREARRSLREIVAGISALTSPEERFTRGFVQTVLVARRHPLFHKLLLDEPEVVLPKYAAVTASQTIDIGRMYMSGVIAMLQAQGRFAGRDPEFMAETLIRLWHSLVLTPSGKVASDDEASLSAYARTFLFPLFNGGQA